MRHPSVSSLKMVHDAFFFLSSVFSSGLWHEMMLCLLNNEILYIYKMNTSWPNARYYPCISLEGLEQVFEDLHQPVLTTCQDLNLLPLE